MGEKIKRNERKLGETRTNKHEALGITQTRETWFCSGISNNIFNKPVGGKRADLIKCKISLKFYFFLTTIQGHGGC